MKILKEQSRSPLKLERHSNSAESIEQNELSEIRSDLCENITASSSKCSDMESNPYNKIGDEGADETKASEAQALEAELQSYLADPQIKKEIQKFNKE